MLKLTGVGGFSEAAGAQAGRGGGRGRGWDGKLRALQPPSYPRLCPARPTPGYRLQHPRMRNLQGRWVDSAHHARQDSDQEFTPTFIPQVEMKRGFLVPAQIDPPGPPSTPNVPRKEPAQVPGPALPCSSSRMLSGLISLQQKTKKLKARLPEPSDKHGANVALGDRCPRTPAVPGSLPPGREASAGGRAGIILMTEFLSSCFPLFPGTADGSCIFSSRIFSTVSGLSFPLGTARGACALGQRVQTLPFPAVI